MSTVRMSPTYPQELTILQEKVHPSAVSFLLSVRGIPHQRIFVGPHGNVYKIEDLAGSNLAVIREHTVS